jgi:hypothetical protein
VDGGAPREQQSSPGGGSIEPRQPEQSGPEADRDPSLATEDDATRQPLETTVDLLLAAGLHRPNKSLSRGFSPRPLIYD